MTYRKRWTAALALLAAMTLTAGCQKTGFVIRPYVQDPGTTQMKVMWTSRAVESTELRYGVAGEALDELPRTYEFSRAKIEKPRVVKGEPEWTGPLPTEYVCTALLTGLQPDTEYSYRVAVSGESFQSTFRTLPDKPRAFTFAVYGDTRTQPKAYKAVADSIAKADPLFAIHTGDITGHGNYMEYKDAYFDPAADMIDRIPVLMARGNHEGGGPPFWQLYEPVSSERKWYSFDVLNAHFTVLDSQAGRKNGPEMLTWLEEDLAASKAQWKFVFYHHPTFDIGSHATKWGRETLTPILRKGGVDMVFCGHSHGYQRFVPMFTPGENDTHPITYVVSAGGGAPLYRVAKNPHTAYTSSRYHFVLITLDGDKLVGKTIAPDGEVFDSWQFTKTDGQYDKAWLAAALPETDFDHMARELGPQLNIAAMLPARPDSRTPVTHTFRLAAVNGKPLKYKLGLEPRSAAKWKLLSPVEGVVPAEGSVDVTFTVQAYNTRVEFYGDTTQLDPLLRLRLDYESGERTGTLYSMTARVSTDEERKAAIEKMGAEEEDTDSDE